jgi:hypothetical protein
MPAQNSYGPAYCYVMRSPLVGGSVSCNGLSNDVASCLAIHAYKRSVRTQGTGALEVLLSDSH